MTIRDLVNAYLLNDGTIAAFLGTRLYPELPQNVVYPVGRLFRVDTVRPGSLRSVASLATARLQIDLYCNGNGAASLHMGSSRAVVDALGAAVRDRLDGFGWKAGAETLLMDQTTSPATGIRAWMMADPETDGVEPELHGGLSRFTADYLVQYQTQGGLY